MLVNTKEFKTVISTFKFFNTTKNLGIDDFKDLNFYIKDNYIYLISMGDFNNNNQIKMVYKFDYINDIDLNGQIYTVRPDDILNSLKFFGDIVDLRFREKNIILINEQDINQSIVINRLETNENVKPYLLQQITLQGLLTNIDGLIENPLTDEAVYKIVEQIKFRNLDKQDNNSYVCFLPNKISIQQFNYTTISNLDCGFTGRIPTPILKLIIQHRQLFEHIGVQRIDKKLIVKSNKLFISIDNIDDNYHLLDNFNTTPNQGIELNKQEVLQIIEFINTFSKNNTGYFEITDSGITFKNTTKDDSESTSVTVKKDIPLEQKIPHREVFGFDISILKGLVSILIDDTFTIHVEQDSDDLDTYLLYVLDNHNKNIMALDVYR